MDTLPDNIMFEIMTKLTADDWVNLATISAHWRRFLRGRRFLKMYPEMSRQMDHYLDRKIQQESNNQIRMAIILGAQIHIGRLLELIQDGNLSILKILLVHDPKIHGQALIYACQYQQISVVRFLIFLKAGLNVQDSEGKNLISVICSQQTFVVNLDLIQLLITGGVDVNSQDRLGRTALSYAREKNYSKVVELLLKAGANCSLQDNCGQTSLNYARKEIVNLLQQY